MALISKHELKKPCQPLFVLISKVENIPNILHTSKLTLLAWLFLKIKQIIFIVLEYNV